MRGSKQMRPRWRRVLNTTNGALGDAIGQKFSEKYSCGAYPGIGLGYNPGLFAF